MLQRVAVVLGLEGQVSLDEDGDFGVCAVQVASELVDVFF